MDKNEAIRNNMVSLSKNKRAKMRSKMLKLIMPLLSRDTGKKLAEAIHKRDVGMFDSMWNKIRNIIDEKLEAQASDMVDLDEAYKVLAFDFESLRDELDNSYIVLGNSIIATKTRELATSGRALFQKYEDVYALTVTASEIQKNESFSAPRAKIFALFENISNASEQQELTAEGSLGDCFTDLVLQVTQKI